MKNLPNGSLAAHVAGMLQSEPGLTSADVSRRLGISDIRAREILTQAMEKDSERILRMFPRPNHDNQLKEYHR
jgi:DNA-binding transcriptional regulator LsrR (DeoR family)